MTAVMYDYDALNRQTLLATAVEGARRSLPEAHQILTVALGTTHKETVKAIGAVVDLYEAWGNPEKAAEWRSRLPDSRDPRKQKP